MCGRYAPRIPGDFELYQDNTWCLTQNNVGRSEFRIGNFFSSLLNDQNVPRRFSAFQFPLCRLSGQLCFSAIQQAGSTLGSRLSLWRPPEVSGQPRERELPSAPRWVGRLEAFKGRSSGCSLLAFALLKTHSLDSCSSAQTSGVLGHAGGPPCVRNSLI